MNSPRYARIAARLLAEEPPAGAQPSESKRAQTIDLVARALSAKKRRRERLVWFSGLIAVAAAALLGYVAVRQLSRWTPSAVPYGVTAVAKPNGNGTAILNQGSAQALTAAAALQQGGRIVAGGSGGAMVQLSTGTQLAVEHDTNLQFENAGAEERFFLSQGAVQARVAKLGAGQRFIIRTLDAEVEVRGTAFRVAVVDGDVACAAGERTRVTVSEGVVEVRRAGASIDVHPGEIWPADCLPSSPAASEAHAARSAPAVKAPAQPLHGLAVRTATEPEQAATDPGASATPPSTEASSIARQNELFSAAAAARQRGDNAGALGSYELLMVRYPASPLAESAAVQRMSLLQRFDTAAARGAARQYLARYPRGYAKTDAEKLLAQP